MDRNSDLPSSSILDFPGHRPLVSAAKLECIAPDFEKIVSQRPECCHRIDGRKQKYITKLHKQLQVVIIWVLQNSQFD